MIVSSILPFGGLSILLVFILTFEISFGLDETTASYEVDVFVSGSGGYFCFKIPTVFQTFNGTLLAFSEARKGECWDWDITDIVISRSYDDGYNWTEPEVLVRGQYLEHRVAGNVAPVQDRDTGRLLIPFNRGNIEAWLTYSDDNGETFEEPTPIPDVIPRAWTWVGFGPPAGLQSSTGRLLIPSYYSTSIIYDNGMLTSTYIMYSDDHGETWQNSLTVSNGIFSLFTGIFGSENQVAQFNDGELIMNSRTFIGPRLISYSQDDGYSWSQQKRVNSLPNPDFGCEGSMITQTFPNGTEILYYSGPDSTTAFRFDLTIWISYNRGRDWERVRLVRDGQIGYSSLLHLHNGKLAILYGQSDVEAVVFVPGKIIYEVYDDVVPFTGPLPTYPSTSYNMSWVDEYDSFDYFETAGYYVLIITNQIVGLIVFVAFVSYMIFGYSTFCCPNCCERRIRLPPLLKSNDEKLVSRFRAMNLILFIILGICSFICFIIGFVSNASQYLLKYDDPARYVRQTWNGLGVGYILCVVALALHYLGYKYFMSKQRKLGISTEEFKSGEKLEG